MDTKYIAFIGLESYDLMHYLSKILVKLDCSVLLIDESESKSLSYTISSDCLENSVIYDYNGIDACSNLKSFDTIDSDYDYVLVDFGFNFDYNLIRKCEEVYLISDLQYQNLIKFGNLELDSMQARFLILREFVAGMSDIFALECLKKLNISQDNIITLTSDSSDLLMKYSCQYESGFKLSKVSSDIIEFLYRFLEVDFSSKEIANAIRLVKKGGGRK